jgi:WD40 repeat protein
MPTTRAARRAAARAAARETNEQASLLGHLLELQASILYQLTRAHDIAAVAPTCHALCDAAKLAMKARPFSGEVVTIACYGSDVGCVAVVPDGRVVTGWGRSISMLRDGACERTIQAHAHAVWGVAVLPGGARFVSGAQDRTAKLWTLDGTLERTFEAGGALLSVAALPDGVHFVVGLGSGENRGEVRLYHIDGTLVHTFVGHSGSVWSVAATPDGQHIISGTADSLVKVWSVASKSLVSTCAGHNHWVRAVVAMPDGQRILSGSMDNTVRVWLLDGTLENTFELHNGAVYTLVALPDNQHALSGSSDNTVKLFNVNDGAVLRTFKHHTRGLMCLALLPDGLRFVSSSEDHTARIAYHGLAPPC